MSAAGRTWVSCTFLQLLTKHKELFWILHSIFCRQSQLKAYHTPQSIKQLLQSCRLYRSHGAGQGEQGGKIQGVVAERSGSHPLRQAAPSVPNKILEAVQRNQVGNEFECNRNILPLPLNVC